MDFDPLLAMALVMALAALAASACVALIWWQIRSANGRILAS